MTTWILVMMIISPSLFDGGLIVAKANSEAQCNLIAKEIASSTNAKTKHMCVEVDAQKEENIGS